MARPIPPNSQTEPDQGAFFRPGIPENGPQAPWHGAGGDLLNQAYPPDDEDGFEVARIPLFTDEQWNRLRRGLAEQHGAISEELLKSWGGLPPDADHRRTSKSRKPPGALPRKASGQGGPIPLPSAGTSQALPARQRPHLLEDRRFWFTTFFTQQILSVFVYLLLRLLKVI